ncbi:MAG: DUF2934 domain-containing protein [Candidatus Omnitrophota bacterium]
MIKAIRGLGKKTSKKKAASSSSKGKTSERMSSAEWGSLIAKKAYDIFENRGYAHGNDQKDWYEAEKAIMKSFHIKKKLW